MCLNSAAHLGQADLQRCDSNTAANPGDQDSMPRLDIDVDDCSPEEIIYSLVTGIERNVYLQAVSPASGHAAA